MTLGKYHDSIPHLIVKQAYLNDSGFHCKPDFELSDLKKLNSYVEGGEFTFKAGCVLYNRRIMIYVVDGRLTFYLNNKSVVLIVNEIINENQYKQQTLF